MEKTADERTGTAEIREKTETGEKSDHETGPGPGMTGDSVQQSVSCGVIQLLFKLLLKEVHGHTL